jgi:hypothetical protein
MPPKATKTTRQSEVLREQYKLLEILKSLEIFTIHIVLRIFAHN